MSQIRQTKDDGLGDGQTKTEHPQISQITQILLTWIPGPQNPRTPEPQNPRTPEPQNRRTPGLCLLLTNERVGITF
jgi:hypothetical protein